MDWFERLTGFREASYDDTRRKLQVIDGHLRSVVNGGSYGIGELELVSLRTLRDRAGTPTGRSKFGIVTGDVRLMHQAPRYSGALFQVASQFNLLEMTSPDVTPEHGVTRYAHDATQGPACAIAAGAATIYRNYFAPVGEEIGQTSTRQINALAALGEALGAGVGEPVHKLWEMRNGYALCRREGLQLISTHLSSLDPNEVDSLRGELCIGLHRDVEVTDATAPHRPVVSQAFCSALPVAYSRVPPADWRALASLVLDAAYEATMLAALMNARRGVSNVVLLTLLGGGAFGNVEAWIFDALRRAFAIAENFDLDVRVVSHGNLPPQLLKLVSAFS
jgi:hypothetical protein